MEQRDFIKNLTGTVCVVGMALNAMSYNNTQMLVNVKYDLPKKSGIFSDYEIDTYSTNTTRQRGHTFLKEKNYLAEEPISSACGSLCQNSERPNPTLMEEAESLFGEMRAASDGELESVNNYIKSISVKTGVDFFTLC